MRLLRPGLKLLLTWFAGAVALALLTDGPDAMRRGVAVLVLPALFPPGDRGVRSSGRSLLPLAMAVLASPGMRLTTGYLTGLVLVIAPLLVLQVGTLIRGAGLPGPWLSAAPVLVTAVDLLLGRLTGSGQAFSMLGLISCYMLFSA